MLLCLGSCSASKHDGPPHYYVDANKIHNPKPHPLKRKKAINPRSYVVRGKRYYVLRSPKGYHRRGIASWYGTRFNGQLTSTGEVYNMLGMTAANRELPIPCYVRVRNLDNGRSVIVKVDDRGPFVSDRRRIIDLSYAAAVKLGFASKGTAHVDVRAITSFDHRHSRHHSHIALNRHATIRHAHLVRQTHKLRKMYLQLGSFHQLASAMGLKNKAAHFTNQPIHIFYKHLHHVKYYVVRVGPLYHLRQTHLLNQHLKAVGFNDVITVSLH